MHIPQIRKKEELQFELQDLMVLTEILMINGIEVLSNHLYYDTVQQINYEYFISKDQTKELKIQLVGNYFTVVFINRMPVSVVDNSNKNYKLLEVLKRKDKSFVQFWGGIENDFRK